MKAVCEESLSDAMASRCRCEAEIDEFSTRTIWCHVEKANALHGAAATIRLRYARWKRVNLLVVLLWAVLARQWRRRAVGNFRRRSLTCNKPVARASSAPEVAYQYIFRCAHAGEAGAVEGVEIGLLKRRDELFSGVRGDRFHLVPRKLYGGTGRFNGPATRCGWGFDDACPW